MALFLTCLSCVIFFVSTCSSIAIPDAFVGAVIATSTFINGPNCSPTAFAVPNGGFESSSLAPWTSSRNTNYSSVGVVSPGRNSRNALQLLELSRAYLRKPAVTQHNIAICPTNNYSVSFDYKFPYDAVGCHLDVFAFHSANVKSATIPAKQTDWMSTSFVYSDFVSPITAVQVALRCGGKVRNSTALVDNLAFTPLQNLEAPGCPKPVSLTNGGFESGSLSPWSIESDQTTSNTNGSIVSPGFNSRYALQVDFQPSNYSNVQINYPVKDLCLAYSYTFSFAYNFVGLKLSGDEYCSLSATAAKCFYSSPGFNPTTGWTKVSWTCESHTNGPSTVGLIIRCGSDTGRIVPTVSILLDNFAVQLAS